MFATARETLTRRLDEIRAAGTWKSERLLPPPQNAHVDVPTLPVSSTCAPTITSAWPTIPRSIAAAHEPSTTGATAWPASASSAARRQSTSNSKQASATFLGTEDTILYSSCFDANGGLFETLLGAEDAIISDELNHASIIDGVRLCKAQRFRYKNNDMADLEAQLKRSGRRPLPLIATDGVFSMDGIIANLPGICDLADKLRRPGHGRRFPRRRLHGQPGPRHARTSRRAWTASTSSPARSARPSAAPAAATPAAEGNHRPAAPALAAVSVLEHPGPADRRRLAQSPRPARARPNCATSLSDNTRFFREGMTAARLQHHARRRIRSARSCSATRALAARMAEAMLAEASTSSASPTRSCRRARPASARRSPPPTPATTWNSPSRNLRK